MTNSELFVQSDLCPAVLPRLCECVDLLLLVWAQQCPCRWKYWHGYHGNHILLFLQTETNQQQQRESGREKLSEEHIKTQSSNALGLDLQSWAWLSATVFRKKSLL